MNFPDYLEARADKGRQTPAYSAFFVKQPAARVAAPFARVI